MKLSDVMSAMGLAGYAEVGLVLFLFAFQLVVFDVLRRGRKLEVLAWLPFDTTRARRRAERPPLVETQLEPAEKRR
jgi:hypothetical protein